MIMMLAIGISRTNSEFRTRRTNDSVDDLFKDFFVSDVRGICPRYQALTAI
jgi:hypothetical protein